MTTRRTIDPYNYFEQLAAKHTPTRSFPKHQDEGFDKWKEITLPKVIKTLGKLPRPVPLNPELLVEWREDGLVKQRWVIDTQPGLSAVLYIFRPENLAEGERRPAILCCHGHGAHGKDPIMGITPDPDRKGVVDRANANYGLVMAKRGFVTYAIDWLGFGERSSAAKPFNYDGYGHRDPCNVTSMCATMLGTTLLAMNCHDASQATDFVCDQPYVDADNLGVMGLSLGGTMTTWMMLTDARFRAADVMCYAGPFYDVAYRTYNVCGSQVTPNLFGIVDTPDLLGMIAPRPMLVELGVYDSCFHIDHTLNDHYRRLEAIYASAGADNLLELDLFPFEHAWGDQKSDAFFRKHLQASW